MIAPIARKQHAAEFERQFTNLFHEVARLARRKGIDRSRGYTCTLSAEDPDDFAQDCLVEYWRVAAREEFPTVQTQLLKRIVRNWIVDAWRKQSHMPKREDFDASTSQLTERTGSPGESSVEQIRCTPEFNGLQARAIEILLLKHVGEFADREIASAMNMTVNGVQSSLKRSRSKLLTTRVNTRC